MAKQVIRMTEGEFKGFVKNILNEINPYHGDNEGIIPTIAHTNNAFKVGEILYFEKVVSETDTDQMGDEVKKNKWRILNSPILKVDADTVTISGEDFRFKDKNNLYTVDKQWGRIRCTDTWYQIHKILGKPLKLKIDYRTINGKDYILVKAQMTQNLGKDEFLFLYDDVRKSIDDPSFRPKYKEIVAENPDFWLRQGEDTPIKSLKQLPNAKPVPSDWMVLRKVHNQQTARSFQSWNINNADRIIEAFPWLKDKVIKWSDGTTFKKTTLEDFYK